MMTEEIALWAKANGLTPGECKEPPEIEILPKVNDAWPAGSVKLLSAKSKPVYGWNPLRWLLRWPLRYEITYHFETQPQETGKP
jgi:hypothetical protein